MIRVLVALLTVAVMLMAVSTAVDAADYNLSYVKVSTGRGALSSGLDVTVKLTDCTRSLTLQGNSDRVNFGYGVEVGNLTASITGGYFKNTPWLGPQFAYDLTDNISLLSWTGWSSGDINAFEWHPRFFVAYHEASVSAGPVSAAWGVSHFQEQKVNHLPAVSYSFYPNGHFKVTTSATYTRNGEELLYQAAVKYTLGS